MANRARTPDEEQLRIRVEVADMLRETMRKDRVTQAELARRIDRTESQVSRYLSGRLNITLDNFVNIARALDRDPVIALRQRG